MGFTPFAPVIQKQYQKNFGATPRASTKPQQSGFIPAPEQKVGGINLVNPTAQGQIDKIKKAIDVEGDVKKKKALTDVADKSSQDKISDLSDGEFALSQINLLPKLFSGVPSSQQGVVGGNISTAPVINNFFPEAKQMSAALETTAQNFGKFMEGGKLTDADFPKYQRMMPQLSDPKPVREFKTSFLKYMLTSKYNNYLKSYNAAGYDTQGLTPLDVPEVPAIGKAYSSQASTFMKDAGPIIKNLDSQPPNLKSSPKQIDIKSLKPEDLDKMDINQLNELEKQLTKTK